MLGSAEDRSIEDLVEEAQYYYARCPSCGKVIDTLGRQYKKMIKYMEPGQALDKLGVKRMCCRARIIKPIQMPIGPLLGINSQKVCLKAIDRFPTVGNVNEPSEVSFGDIDDEIESISLDEMDILEEAGGEEIEFIDPKETNVRRLMAV